MYPLFNPIPQTTDPIAIERQKTGRPASHLEIMQNHQHAERLRWRAVADREAVVGFRKSEGPALLESIRRSLSRVLINAGERIDPQTA